MLYLQKDPLFDPNILWSSQLLLLQWQCLGSTSIKQQGCPCSHPMGQRGRGTSVLTTHPLNTLQNLDGFSKQMLGNVTDTLTSHHPPFWDSSRCWPRTRHTSFLSPARSTWRWSCSPAFQGGLVELWREAQACESPAVLQGRAELWPQGALPLLERRLQFVTLNSQCREGWSAVTHCCSLTLEVEMWLHTLSVWSKHPSASSESAKENKTKVSHWLTYWLVTTFPFAFPQCLCFVAHLLVSKTSVLQP